MKITKYLIGSDFHCPWFDAAAVKIFLDIGSQFRPDQVILAGDFQDVYLPSKYRKSPHKLFTFIDDELEKGRELLSKIEKLKAKKYYYLEGNHEFRLTADVFDKIGYLSRYLNPRELLKIPKGWAYLPYGKKCHVDIPNLVVTHGVKCPKHSAYNYLINYQTSVLFGHTHRTQTYSMTNYRGEVLTAFNIGWLGDPETAAEYVKDVANATQSFALVWASRAITEVQIVRIDKGRALFNGKIFAA